MDMVDPTTLERTFSDIFRRNYAHRFVNKIRKELSLTPRKRYHARSYEINGVTYNRLYFKGVNRYVEWQ